MCVEQTLRWRVTVIMTLVVLLLTTTACGGEDRSRIRIGAGSTTEQRMIVAIASIALSDAGYDVTVLPDLGDTASVRRAAKTDGVDVYFDYSGAAWSVALGLAAAPNDPRESYEAVAAEELENGLQWLAPTQVNAALTFFVSVETLDENPPTMSWLAGRLGSEPSTVCADQTYLSAVQGYPYLVETYAIATDSVTTRPLGETQAVQAVVSGNCTTALASATNETAASAGLVALTDDQRVFPAMVLAPVVRAGSIADDAAIIDVLERTITSLTTQQLAVLVANASNDASVDVVARRYVTSVTEPEQ